MKKWNIEYATNVVVEAENEEHAKAIFRGGHPNLILEKWGMKILEVKEDKDYDY